jgi:hypothetical protein
MRQQIQAIPSVPPHKAAEERDRLIEVTRAKPHPAGHDREHRKESGDENRRPIEDASQPGAIEDKKSAVMHAPDHERPIGAVPQAAQHEHEPKIAIGGYRRAAVSTQRYIQIVTQPL